MKVFFNEIFDYNYYCNKKIIAECMALEEVPQRTIVLFSHIVNAHHIWNARMEKKAAEFGVWQVHEYKAWADIHYENQRNSFEIMSNVDSFDKRIDYENSEGRLFTNTIKDMLFHIVNHSTNHRGQIAADLRNNGITPIGLDYIHYKR